MRICDIEVKHRLAWRWLGALILLFLAGYIYYGFKLVTHPAQLQDLFLSFILFAGGIFVIMVVRFSLNSMNNIKEIAESERHRALHDELTELPNRTLLYERIEQAMLLAERERNPISILLMDLNRFKEINDTLGHFYGDYLLQMIAPRLRKSIRKSDTIARFGGDEFAVVLPGVELEQAIQISEKIALSMEEPFQIEGNLLSIDVSIGIALYPDHGSDSDTLLQHADVALYAAKKSSSSCYDVYNADHDEHSMARLMLTVELREAIRKGELVLYYQPKYSLREGKVCGLEALVRWPRKEGEDLLLPGFFLPIAEKTGLIRPLTYLIFDKVFQQVSQWNEQGSALPVSINLSTKVLHDVDLPDKVHTLLKKWQIDPTVILLEITENSMMVEPDLAFRIIQDLVDLGFKLSIDDFGTGYSSLALLKKLPGCELKIDKSFIADMDKNAHDLAIVQTSINLARNMELTVVAEGVESRETLDRLIAMECEMAQGYFLCRPAPAEKIQEMIVELNATGYQLAE
ncbi:MAG: EAL domain-containing protein [Desulfobulbaceae bacterium]|nr:EAL domain-containing protein [Desulfobulbaceae bacterium]